jgi:hypothetical protein
VLRFDQTAARLAGFVLGANASLKAGLKCDVAEVLVFTHQLSPAEIDEHAKRNVSTPNHHIHTATSHNNFCSMF